MYVWMYVIISKAYTAMVCTYFFSDLNYETKLLAKYLHTYVVATFKLLCYLLVSCYLSRLYSKARVCKIHIHISNYSRAGVHNQTTILVNFKWISGRIRYRPALFMYSLFKVYIKSKQNIIKTVAMAKKNIIAQLILLYLWTGYGKVPNMFLSFCR